jgi:hypothetical protein
MRSQPVLVEQRENIVDDLVLGLGEEVRLRESRLRDSGMGIPAAELGDDVVEVLLRAEAFPFEHFHNRGNLLHVGDGRFLDGHGFACGAWIAHFVTLSASKGAFGCGITSCRTQLSTELHQHSQVEFVSSCLGLSY